MGDVSDNLAEALLDQDNLGCESKLQLVRWIRCLAKENIVLRARLHETEPEVEDKCGWLRWLFPNK